MKCDKQNMLLYAVTDRAWVGKQTLYEQVESALKGGVTCVQLREKELDDDAFLTEAVEIHALCTPSAWQRMAMSTLSFTKNGTP